jgi:riboflavin kinase/FMN adenylyltransferase
MEVHYISLESEVEKKFFNLAIGNFDGVHLGHQKIIRDLVNDANEQKRPSAILSFEPHPRQFFSRDLDRYQIIGTEIKQKILSDLGINNLFFLKFDQLIANLSPTDFIKRIIIDKLQINKLVVGYDFHFGKNREGDVIMLRDYATIHGFELEVVDPIKETSINEVFSSSAIRQAIKDGYIKKANMMLGYEWTMEGEVIHGNKRAREMNFPTANLLPHDQIYPMKGVYAVNIVINQNKFNGIANFGERPTVDGNKLLLEVHIFNFNEDIYGKHLTVEFLTFIRGEQKFDNFSLLVEQIKKDIQISKDYHLSN